MRKINSFIRRLFNNRTIEIVTAILAVTISIRYIKNIEIPLQIVSLLSLWIACSSIRKSIRVSWPLIIFVTILAISLFISPTTDYLARIFRFIAFIIGMLCFSPLIYSTRLEKYRRLMAVILFISLTICVGISFLIYLYVLIIREDIFSSTFYYYGFTGIFNRGMALSPMAALVAIGALWISINGHLKPRWRILGLTIALTGTITCIAAGSRMAVISLFICMILIAVCQHKILIRYFRTRTGVITVAVLFIILCVSLPYSLKVINYKQSIADKHNSILFSRAQKWQTRWAEFESSPLLGIGYANAFKEKDNLGETPGAFIPGSSWLTVLTYGGIAGGIPFLWFMFDLVKRLWRRRGKSEYSLLSGLLVFFLLNGMTEGWLLFAGALMFPLFWLTCSEIYAEDT